MRFEDQSPSGQPLPPPPPPGGDPEARPRRRANRSWSSPAPTPRRFDPPPGGADWSAPPRRSFGDSGSGSAAPPAPPRPSTALGAPPPGALSVDLGPVTALLREMRAELDEVRAAVSAPPTDRERTLITGQELAAAIEALGATLGNGMATLLTEHRNLLARDLDAAADRILEEVAQRLRSSGSQTVDGVEERLRQVLGKAVHDLTEQLDLRLDQLQTDLTGLRAVLLEVPDQTSVMERLDQVLESAGAARNLATEVAALRRRVSLRGEGRPEALELSDEQMDEVADRVAARLRPARGGAVRIAADEAAIEIEDEDGPEERAKPAKPARAGRRPPRSRS